MGQEEGAAMTRIAGRLMVLVCLAAVGCGPRAEPPPAWFGLVAPLSGPGRAAGERARRGAVLAVEEAAEARVGGRRLGALFADGRGEEEPTRAATVRLLAVNKVTALVGGPGATAGEALTLAAQPYGVPVVLTTTLPPTRTEGSFTVAARPEARGRALAAHVARLGVERVAVLTDERDPAAVALAAAFVQECRKAGRAATREWPAPGPPADEDVKAAAAWRPGTALLAVGPQDFARLRSRLTAAGFSCPALYGGEDAAPDELRSEDGVVMLATAYDASGLGDRGKAFAKRYAEKFGEPPDVRAALAYEASRLLLEAEQQANSTTAARVRDQIGKAETYEGVTGTVTLKERAARRPVFLVVREDGRTQSVTAVADEP
jgi:branched-chain amino acid transport system substrate-binding protein